MTISLKEEEITKIAKKTLSKYKICDHCLGRIFAKIEHGKTNQKRGEILRNNLSQDKKTKTSNCWLCNGLIDEIPHFAELIKESLKDYEFDTFLVGSKVDEDILDREQALNIQNQLNQKLTEKLERYWKKNLLRMSVLKTRL